MQNWYKNIVNFSLILLALGFLGCETYNREEAQRRPAKKLKTTSDAELASLDNGSKTKYPGERDYWFGCRYQNDCIEIFYNCVGNAVNRKFQSEASEFYAELDGDKSCGPNRKPTAQGYTVECIDNLCTYQ